MADITIISETIQEFCGERFYLCGHYFQHNGKRLHRAVWEHFNGEIPEGYHVHHIDENRANNEIENLSLIPGVEHIKHHSNSEQAKEKSKRTIIIASACAAEWHHSPEGKAWHSEKSKRMWESMEPRMKVCDECGKEYSTTAVRNAGNHFCSNACKSAYRRRLGIDNETRSCTVCGKEYAANKYSTQKTCSYECARMRRWGK